MSYRRRAPAFRPSLSRRAELGLGGEKEEEEEAFFICEVRRGAAYIAALLLKGGREKVTCVK